MKNNGVVKFAAAALAVTGLIMIFCYLSPYVVGMHPYKRRTVSSSQKHFEKRNEADSMEFLPISKDLVVHSAYFDDRPTKGHFNTTVILITAHESIFTSNLITRCGVGVKVTTDFIVRPIYQSSQGSDHFPYEHYVIECYDLPVVNGTKAFVTYYFTAADGMTELKVESQVMVPAPRVSPTGKFNFTVATCTKAYNREVAYLPEFVRYQKAIGVEHVHLTVLEDFISDDGFRDIIIRDTYLRKSLYSGYLSFKVLKNWYSEKESAIPHLHLDCFYRLRGTYDFISIADAEDFFTPRMYTERSVKYYLQKYCIEGVANAGSCQFKWRWVYPDVCGVHRLAGSDGNVTNTVNIPKLEDYHQHLKSIHLSAAVVDFNAHEANGPSCMLPGYTTVEMPSSIAYFAHNTLHSGKNKTDVC